MATNTKPYAVSSYAVTQIEEKQSDNSYIAYPIGTTGQYVLVDYDNKTVLLQTGIDNIVERLEQIEQTNVSITWTEI